MSPSKHQLSPKTLSAFRFLFQRHPFIFTSLFLLIFTTIILVIAAVFINQPKTQPSTQLTDSQAAYEEAKTYSEAHPIMAGLPIIYAHYDANYNYTEFRIDGGEFSGCKTNFCLKITDTTGGNYDAALEKIRESGFNPEDFQILYEYTPIKELN